jgi:hypothetical protein
MHAAKTFALAACVVVWCSPSAPAQPEISAPAFSYANPLDFRYDQGQTAVRREVRDPCIIQERGTYYLVFTMWPFSNREERRLSEPNQGGSPGLALYSSKDLKNWAFENWLVKSSDLPDNCPYKNRFWAPEIHKIGGRFYVIFTADNWIDGKYNKPGKWGSAGYSFIGVADKVTGPYRHITYVEGGTCDMTLFADGDGRCYAIKPKGDVFLQEIDLTRLDHDDVGFVGAEQRVVTASNDDIGLATSPAYLEGPWLEKIGREYCLFYAALYQDKAFPDQLGYRTGVAYADSMAGPWRKDPRGAVFLGGHLAVFDGPDGGKWFSYRNEKDGKNQGLLCIDPIDLDATGRVEARETTGPKVAAGAAWHPAAGAMLTRWAAEVTPAKVLPEYPRPQLVREKWQGLNGLWDYAVSQKGDERAPSGWDGQILVPYCIESALSGVMKPLLPSERLWYHRFFRVPADWRGGDQHVLLHFGAVDWECAIYVNGKDVGSHRGGYDAFTVDATDALKRGDVDQEIAVSVWAPADSQWQLHGKQSLHPAGCSYTACSGIWQTVWAEPVETAQVSELKLATDIDPAVLHVTVCGYLPIRPYTLTVSAYDGQARVAEATSPAGPPLEKEVADQLVDFYHSKSRQFTQVIDLPIANARLWSPDTPFLYDLRVELKDEGGRVADAVTSYFGVRKVSLGRDKDGFATLEINGKRTFLAGALDQGYWPDGIYTAPTDEALRYDLEAARRLGINCLRKHVKIEPQRWYYWADQLGILVLQDMPTGNEGDAFTDKPRSPEAAAQCESEMRTLIRQRWDHPSIIGWAMYNEGWGQHDTLATAEWAKQLDPTRLIDEASGFPWHGGGDVRDHHGGAPGRYKDQIGIVSENGGWGLASPGHDWSTKPWTYTTCDPLTGKDTTGFLDKRDGKPIPAVDAQGKSWFTKHMVAFYKDFRGSQGRGGGTGNFICQLIDVENECDGLLSYDRAVFKVDPDAVRQAARGTPAEHVAQP